MKAPTGNWVELSFGHILGAEHIVITSLEPIDTGPSSPEHSICRFKKNVGSWDPHLQEVFKKYHESHISGPIALYACCTAVIVGPPFIIFASLLWCISSALYFISSSFLVYSLILVKHIPQAYCWERVQGSTFFILCLFENILFCPYSWVIVWLSIEF